MVAEGDAGSVGGRAAFEGHVVEVVQQAGFGQAGVGERGGPEAPGLCADQSGTIQICPLPSRLF